MHLFVVPVGINWVTALLAKLSLLYLAT